MQSIQFTQSMQAQAITLLKQMLNNEAAFRDGQLEAIELIAQQHKRVLVVQRTGWGKSIVYFLATKLLRQQGSGVTLLISPLLSLMRNQLEMAQRIGIHAEFINSTNEDEWNEVEERLKNGQCDVLMVSPERLANQRFHTRTLPAIYSGGGIGLLVIDEAHCISDWGHDFRPDYRRIVRIVENLPKNLPVIATTATANNRVVADVEAQLGNNLTVIRGSLARASLRLQNIRLADQAERLAWLAQNLPDLPGSGIIYCLTVADCHRVAEWLCSQGLNVIEYHSRLSGEERQVAEQQLLQNQVKALVATVALGMGFDKPDLGFVIHFQRPGSLVAYYQQIGRAGRAVDNAYAVLLNGREDDEIQEYFIKSAFPGEVLMQEVVQVLEKSDEGLKISEILGQLNYGYGKVEQALKLLEIEGAIYKDKTVYFRTPNQWQPDIAHAQQITARRYQELEQMKQFVDWKGCLMEFVAQQLDDPYAQPCGKCANCQPPFFSSQVAPFLVQEAIKFLHRDFQTIEPRIKWPNGGILNTDWKGNIPKDRQNEAGRSLCIYGDAGWGKLIRNGKYQDDYFGDELVTAMVELIQKRWLPQPAPTWVTAVPSLRHIALVPNLAARVAKGLNLPFLPVIHKVKDSPPQKTMENSNLQAANVFDAFKIVGDCPSGPVLLIDDMVDSRWTLTICGFLLREAGSGPVFPLTLAVTTTSGDF